MNPDPHHFPDVSWADCRAEVDREAAYRARTYPDRVAGGRMQQADADYQLAIIGAIAADVDRMTGAYAPAAHRYIWLERRQALDREIDLRRRLYPEWVEKGRLTQRTADRQILLLRAILWRYDCGFDWAPSNGVRDLSAAELITGKARTPAQEETWAEMHAIWRRPDGFFYQRWPDETTPAAEPELAL